MSVLITGANGGLGTAVAQAFFETGAKTIGVARSWQGSMPFPTISADLTTKEGCETMVAEALKQGSIDALVHLVGAFGGGAPVWEMDDKTWDGMMSLNLTSAFYTVRAALKPMVAAKKGRVVAVASRAALYPMANFAAYAAAKAGLVALVKNIAMECKDLGVTANAIVPSIIDTEANRKAMPQSDFSKWVQPESIAKLLVWLASDAAGDVSGAVIPIYGRS